MRLTRYPYGMDGLEDKPISAGSWRTVNGNWIIAREHLTGRHWCLSAGYGTPGKKMMQESFAETMKRQRFLELIGLDVARFPSRKAAVAALQAALADSAST